MAVDLGPDGLTLGSTTINDWADVGGGKVLQVVQAFRSSYSSFSTNSTWTDISGLSVSITPSSTSSKILVMTYVSLGGGDDIAFRITRNGTAIGIANAQSNRLRAGFGGYTRDSFELQNANCQYLDSPSTTSAITYKTQIFRNGGGTTYLNCDPQYNTENNNNTALGTSNIIVMEIAG